MCAAMRIRCSHYVRGALCGLLLGSTTAVHAQEGGENAIAIKDVVLKQGIFEEIVLTDYPSLDFSKLVEGSDLIVEVAIRSQRSFVHGDGHTVSTDYGVQVMRTLKSREPATEAKASLTIRKRGGSVTFERRTFVSVENGFPSFQAGEQYVLFLRAGSDPSVYELFAGPSGACRIVDGSVTSTLAIKEFRDTVVRHANSRLLAVTRTPR